MQRRWMGVGSSGATSTHDAATEAATAALGGRDDPALLVTFASIDHDLADVGAALTAAAPGVPVVGCSTAGEIATDGPADATVVVAALGGPGLCVNVAVAEDAGRDLRAAGATAAGALHHPAIEQAHHQLVLLLSDGLAGDQEQVVRGAYSVAGAAVPLVGGCAGDDLRMQCTRQLVGTSARSGAVIGVAIGSDGPFGVGVRHGWRRVGEPMLITRSAGSRVLTIDDRPALDAYLDRLDAPPEAHHDAAAFTRFAQTHPLGLRRRGGEEVRFIAEAGFEDRSLGCIANVTQGTLAWLMAGDEASVLTATEEACAEALTALGEPPIGVLAFDCIARRGVLGEHGIKDEVQRIAALAGAPVAGFYTYGEIARTRGTGGFHNQTLVVLAVA